MEITSHKRVATAAKATPWKVEVTPNNGLLDIQVWHDSFPRSTSLWQVKSEEFDTLVSILVKLQDLNHTGKI
jgi:hypothetical protein